MVVVKQKLKNLKSDLKNWNKEIFGHVNLNKKRAD